MSCKSLVQRVSKFKHNSRNNREGLKEIEKNRLKASKMQENI